MSVGATLVVQLCTAGHRPDISQSRRNGCCLLGLMSRCDMTEPSAPLTVPDVVNWPIFPFEGDMRVREIQPRLDQERVRNGDPGGDPCHRCAEDASNDAPIWSNGRWAVRRLTFNGRASPFPAYMLEIVEHADIDALTEDLAAELGVLTLRLNNALLTLGTVGRVHFNRWGDGAAHFHVWFLGRPAGAWQFSGYTLPLWGFTLPSLPEDELAANDLAIAASLKAAAANAPG